jgi:hypothetical protein
MIARKLWLFTPRRTFVGINTKLLSKNAILQEQFKATDTKIFANLIDFFCNQEGCLTYLGEDKKTGMITFDRGHLTPVASDYLAEYLLVDLIVGNTNALNSANPAP